jgi:hypothetical protein
MYKSYLLTPWGIVLLEKLTGSQLVKFPAFYGIQRVITALFTSARHYVQIITFQKAEINLQSLRREIFKPHTQIELKYSYSPNIKYLVVWVCGGAVG